MIAPQKYGRQNLILAVVEGLIECTFSVERAVITRCDDLSFIKDKNRIGIANRAEAVSNDKNRFILH